MSAELLINVTPEETRLAVIENGAVQEIELVFIGYERLVRVFQYGTFGESIVTPLEIIDYGKSVNQLRPGVYQGRRERGLEIQGTKVFGTTEAFGTGVVNPYFDVDQVTGLDGITRAFPEYMVLGRRELDKGLIPFNAPLVLQQVGEEVQGTFEPEMTGILGSQQVQQ